MNFETLYSNINGELVNGDESLNIYGDKLCAELSEKAYKLKQKINKRLGADEDEELCELLDIYEEIKKEASRQIYLYCTKKQADSTACFNRVISL